MKRFEVINGSKFERMSQAEMQTVKGGMFCISCMKREREWRIGLGTPSYKHDYIDSAGFGHTIP